jgi:serine/threonine-protein kinase
MAAELTAHSFLDYLRASGLLDAAQLDELSRCPESRDRSAKALARVVYKRGWLTRFQLNAVASGRAQDLSIGPYTVLDRLGEGGMGMVYKARHQPMRRVVALKVIRKERLANPAIVNRFYQEVQLAAQLAHPNIVLAYDAGQAGSTHYFAMEYVEGVDLARLVRENGPLPWPRACEYLRQAALGLQHAHEKGLVHRDIKPSNLLVSKVTDRAGATAEVVKLLDLGLARLQSDGETGLTRAGCTVGTPDYMAPEQAMNSRAADIRADLYSLGCTLLYLLSGATPFGHGELTEVLLKHQMEKPTSLAERGVKVPEEVQAILDRLVAKDPDDRFQTPAELAEALAPLCRAEVPAGAVRAAARREPADEDEWGTQTLDDVGEKSRTASRPGRRKADSGDRTLVMEPPGAKKPVLILAGAGAAAVLLVLGLLGGLLYWKGRTPATEHVQGPVATEPASSGPATTAGQRPPPQGGQVPVAVAPEKLPLPQGDLYRALAYSPNGRFVAIGGQKLLLWDVVGSAVKHDFGSKDFGIVESLAWSADGLRLVAGCRGGQVFLLDPESGKPVMEFVGHSSPVVSVAISADGRHILGGGGKVQKKDGQNVRTPDGKSYVHEDNEVIRWDAATGQQVSRHRGVTTITEAVAFTADGKRLACFYRVDSHPTLLVWDADKPDPVRRTPLPDGRNFPAFSPKGPELAVLGGDWAWHVHDVETGRELRHSESLATKAVRCLAWSGDGRYLACGLPKQANEAAGAVALTDAATGAKLKRFEGPTNNIYCVALSPDGRYAVAGGPDGVRLWDRDKP